MSSANALDRLWERYESQVQHLHPQTRRGSGRPPVLYRSQARAAPMVAITGAFIDHEDAIRGTYRDEYGVVRRDASAFNHLVGSKQAIFFIYSGYGREFPEAFVRHVNDNGAAAQIAFRADRHRASPGQRISARLGKGRKGEPHADLPSICERDDGDWTSYHKDPGSLHREIPARRQGDARRSTECGDGLVPVRDFRNDLSSLTILAPKPSIGSASTFTASRLTTTIRSGTRNVRNPADALRFIYGKYADQHPIMIAEYAASHMSSLDMKRRDEFAINKIGQMYAALPRLYPRVKAICWLSMNANQARDARAALNDYSLLEGQGREEAVRAGALLSLLLNRSLPSSAGDGFGRDPAPSII